jgi:uncharacterized membrane protein
MKKIRNCATIFGALSFAYTMATVAPGAVAQPVQAKFDFMNSNVKLECSEERIGNHKFQVSKTIVNAPCADVFNVLTDYDQTTRIFSKVKKCQVVGDNGSTKLINFEIEAPGNFGRFDYVLEVKETYPNLIEWHRVSGAFKANEGYWKLVPVSNGNSTLVTYSKFIDGGFLYPQFLVNHEIRQSMPEVMGNLKSTAEQVYKVAKASDKTLHPIR